MIHKIECLMSSTSLLRNRTLSIMVLIFKWLKNTVIISLALVSKSAVIQKSGGSRWS